MWIYNQSNGNLIYSGELVATGYSGHGEGRNNPAMEKVHDVGPIPRGLYTIGPMFNSQSHGPCVMRLFPDLDTTTFGRSGFLIHGDSFENPGQASLGCVIMPRPARLRISQSGDDRLEVV